ncbi:histone-lysine N-methyltransferase SETMAR-like [Prorops nasuta]|uniref:histone-lysine N-methyltransferase SETMAR-like n=1 Tax=Prorops nasuta TaxID=863751 RepID=UPI0034CFEA5C
MHRNLLRPFHFQRGQQLPPHDYVCRVYFCEGSLAQCCRDETFLDRILWTDESTFTPNGVFNRRNLEQWADENPHSVREGAFQYRYTINVWAGLVGNQIGPVFLPPRLNGNVYAEFLENELGVLLENVPLKVQKEIIFQHDGAPAHYRWIGRGEPIAWPPRSPDLTPLDFFLWVHIKNLGEPRRGGTEDEVRNTILESFKSLTPDMVQKATRILKRRAEVCLNVKGAHFEQLL